MRNCCILLLSLVTIFSLFFLLADDPVLENVSFLNQVGIKTKSTAPYALNFLDGMRKGQQHVNSNRKSSRDTVVASYIDEADPIDETYEFPDSGSGGYSIEGSASGAFPDKKTEQRWWDGVINNIEKDYMSVRFDDAGNAILNNFALRSRFSPSGVEVVPPRSPFEDESVKWSYDFELIKQGDAVVTLHDVSPVGEGDHVVYDYGVVKEIYKNYEKMLEQIFVVQKPIGLGNIELTGKVRSNLRAVEVGEDYIIFSDDLGRTFDYNGLVVYDSNSNAIPARMSWDGGSITLDISVSNKTVYPIYVDPGLEPDPAWTAVGGEENEIYGIIVSAAGDVNADGYSDGMVSAPFLSGVSPSEGKVYLYAGSSVGLSVAPVWTKTGEFAGDGAFFGFGCSTAGDVNGDGFSDVIIGASSFDTAPMPDAGAAYVFYGSASWLSIEPDWSSTGDEVMTARFGHSVASAGDVNGDGFDDVIIGAFAQGSTGKAFVYLGSATGLETTYSWSSTGEASQGSLFGTSVTGAGDINGDGYDDVIIGAPSYSSSLGKAYVYHGSSTGPSETFDWSSSGDGAASQKYGFSVSTAGDVNGDGFDDVIVGAVNHASNIGKAYVYHGSGGGLSLVENWSSNGDGQAGAEFGISVSTAGDVNDDGFSDVIVGSYKYDNGNIDTGKAYAFYGAAGGLPAAADWTSTGDNQASAHFGMWVATAGDVNGDGGDDVIVSAPFNDSGFTNNGKVFVFHGSSTGINVNIDLVLEVDTDQKSNFGFSVSGAGDVNGDGFNDIIIGAPFFDSKKKDEGKAYVYLGSSSGPATEPAWSSFGDDVKGANFGFSVSGAGDINGDGYDDIIIGAWTHSGKGKGCGNDAGKAYVYLGSSEGLSGNYSWSFKGEKKSRLGISVSSAGDVNGDGYGDVIVGAYKHSFKGKHDAGIAYAFYGSSSGLPTAPDWTGVGDKEKFSRFGISVSSAGDVNGDGYGDVIIGAYRYGGNPSGNGIGKAYVYYGSADGLDKMSQWSSTGDSVEGAGFGFSTSSAGDVNGDGYGDILIGAWTQDVDGDDEVGKAFLFYGSGTGLSVSPDWTSSGDGQENSRFGSSVSSAGDFNADGFDDIMVGAPFHDGINTGEAGRVYIYPGSDTGVSDEASIIEGEPLYDQYSTLFNGGGLSGLGDVNGDGGADIIVGCGHWRWKLAQKGATYVLYGKPLSP